MKRWQNYWHLQWRVLSVVFILIGFALMAAAPAGAQSETVITLGLAEYMRNFPVDDMLAQFEAQNPGVKVQPVYIPFSDLFVPSAASSLDDHLNAEQKLASAADVLLIDESSLSNEATRAGYYLDLSPLAATDSALDPSVFLPAAWDAFRWDNGLWALPAKIDATMLIYDVDAFDRAGLAYPNGSWTLDDLANAARALTQRDASGSVTQPGLITNGANAMLLRSLLHASLIDPATAAPHFYTPELQNLLEQWKTLIDEGIIAVQSSNSDLTVVQPMQIGRSQLLGGFALPDQQPPNLNASALPGGSVGTSTSGIAVSAGTAYPQQAYALAKFLTSNPQALSLMFGSKNARTDVTAEVSGGNVQVGGGAFSIAAGGGLSPEKQAVVDTLLSNALPASELRFADYLNLAIQQVVEGSADAATALQNAELHAVGNLQTAADRKGAEPLIVATPVPDIVMNPGEIDLHFGAGFTAQNGDWERLMRDFAAADPLVGKVTLDTDFGSLSDYANRDDCFYLNYNAIPSADLSKLLPLDPLLSTDSTFSPDDVAGNALAQVQRDNRTWAFPLNIAPELLKYHADLFAQAGIPAPTNGWTISAFVDALHALKNVIPADKTPFSNRGFGDSYLLALIAAYGGLPLDFRTNPPTINFTDPATVEAIRQTLDLAKDKLVAYSELASNLFIVAIGANDENPDPLYNEVIGGGVRFLIGGPAQDTSNPYHIASFPSGTYSTASYTIGAGYISASSQSPDACYRLFRFLSSHPELFGSMPALRSQFSSPALTASEGADAANFYTSFDAMMQDANTIVIPSSFSGQGDVSGTNIVRRWLDKAFDDYVLHDADLLTVLSDAQTKAVAFQTCVAGLPPYDPSNPAAYANGVKDCGTALDPDVAALFPSSAN